MKFNKDAKGYHGTEDIYYALFEGYIDVDGLLVEEGDRQKVREAMETISEFLTDAEDLELIGEECEEED